MKKTLILTIIISFILLSFPSCGKQPQEENNNMEQKLRESANADIASITLCDLDLDGQKEAFALMGEETKDSNYSDIYSKNVYNSEIWFCGKTGAKKLADNAPRSDDGIFKIGEQSFYVSSEYYATHVVSNIYYVKDGSVVETDISGKGGSFTVNDNGDVSLTFTDHDGGYTYGMFVGKPDKTYYFRWNSETEHFEEYGGSRISMQKFSELKGAAEFLKQFDEEQYTVEEILYYENGEAALNFYKDDGRYHIRVAVKDGALADPEMNIELSRREGYLRSAAIPEIAVYPDTGENLGPLWQPKMYADKTASYKIEKKTYSINDSLASGEIFYPFISGGKEFDTANDLILNAVEEFYNEWTESKTEVSLTLDYDVTLETDELISIVFRGFVNNKAAPHPSNIRFSLNIDPDRGKLTVFDIVNVNNDLFKLIDGSLSQLDIDEQGDYIRTLDIKELFTNADKRFSSVYTYYDCNYMYLAIAVPHAIGDFVELKIEF